MGGGENRYNNYNYSNSAWAPVGAPLNSVQREVHWRHFDNSVDAVSFGFVATAILISMFLVIAILERFFRPTSPIGNPTRGDVESQLPFNTKLGYPSPNSKIDWLRRCGRGVLVPIMTVYANGVSVLMPGDDIPSFIAHPAPAPCPPECISWPHHQHHPSPNSSLISNSNSMQED